MELAPGSDDAGEVDDGGTLPSGQVADTVQLDEILRTSTPRRVSASPPGSTSRASPCAARAGDERRARHLTPFAENTDDVLKVLRDQSGATRRLIRNTGEVFSALSERQGQLAR